MNENSVTHPRQAEIDQLVHDYRQAQAAGTAPSVNDWLAAHPELAAALRASLASLAPDMRPPQEQHSIATPAQETAVFRATPSAPFTVEVDTNVPVGTTLRVRCPHCHRSLEVAARDPLDKVHCQACGRVFGVVPQTTGGLQPHQRIRHFQLVDRLGMGGFGIVWKAHDTHLNRWVALKVPRPGRLEPDDVARFLAEARAVAQLNHPGIVPVHEISSDDDQIYIISDLIDGLPLNRHVARQGGLSYEEAVLLCVQIAEALEHAHAAGIVHRDLKPGNILVDANHRAHLTDFGLAKGVPGSVTMTIDGAVLGTPAYMSPEQASGQSAAADQRSDIYSLGVILYELLTGERPFRGDANQLIQQVLHNEPPRLRDLRSTVPADLETICLKCLEKEPHKRYVSARAVADDLGRWLAGEAIHARPVSLWGRTHRWSRRNPLLAGLIVTLATMTLLATAGTISITRNRQRDLQDAVVELTARRHHDTPEIQRYRNHVSQAAAAAIVNGLHQQSRQQQQEFLKAQFARASRDDVAGGEEVASWYFVDPHGILLAVYPANDRIVDQDFSQRDYFRGVLQVPPGTPYVSAPFRSQNDGLYKFAVCQTLYPHPNSAPVGIVAASVTTESTRAIARQERMLRILGVWIAIVLTPLVAFGIVAMGLACRRDKRLVPQS